MGGRLLQEIAVAQLIGAWTAYPYRRDGSFKEEIPLRFHDHQYRSNAAWRYVYFLCASRISGSSVSGGDRFFDRGL